MQKRLFLILPGLFAVHLLFLIFIRFTAWPEMLSYPYLFNNGFTLYKDFVQPYPPVLVLILAGLYRVFGYSLIALKIFTWILILANDVLIYKIVKKVTGKGLYAVAAVALYVFTQPFLEGNQLWFDLAIVTPILAGAYFLIAGKNARNLIIAGISFGLAALTKQTSGLFLLGGAVYLFFTSKAFKKPAYFLIGPAVLGLIFVAYLAIQGSLADFINWNLIYPFTFWSKFPGYVQMNLTNYQMVVLGTLLFPVFAIIAKNYREIVREKRYLLFGGFLTLAIVMVYPRFSFFHFQLALAFIAVLFGCLLARFKFSPVLLATFALLTFFVIVLPSVKRDWGTETRFWSRDELEFAGKVAGEVGGGRVHLLGQPSSVYVFSKTLPPKPWLDGFGWYFEIPGMQDAVIKRWSNNPPEFIIWQLPVEGNWYDLGTYRPKEITDWIESNFVKKEEIGKGIFIWQKRN